MFKLKNQTVSEDGYKHTISEILHQPQIWEKAFNNYKKQKDEIDKFLEKIIEKSEEKVRVIFTGAGTSEYVGNVVVEYLKKNKNFQFESIATTDIVSSPELYLDKKRPTILVSFARSGNSPESIAAVDLVDQLVENQYHLAITCAEDGKLATGLKDRDNAYVLLMPEGSNDKSFAMTSAFTSMLLSTLLVFDIISEDEKEKHVNYIKKVAKSIIDRDKEIVDLVEFNFDRIVYLGSGTHYHLTNEARLKILELTAGEVVTCNESSMGFRHGPKSFIDENTFLVSFVSNNPYTRKYDLDILREVASDKIAKKVLAITPIKLNEDFDEFVIETSEEVLDVYLTFPFIMFGQLVSLLTANRVGNKADTPSKTGTVNRVVKGVQIHEYK